MNPIKSLINETKPFPPYHQMIDSLNMNIESEKKIVESLSSFVEQDLSIIYENQPDVLQKCIEIIQNSCKKQADLMQNMISAQLSIPNTMITLNTLYKEIQNELSIISNARDTATESQLMMDKSIQNLNKIKDQKSIDQSKIQEANQEVTKATHQFEKDTQNADDIQKARSQNINEYRKKFVESLAISLKTLSQIKESFTKEIHQVSEELKNSLLILDQSDEPSFPALEDRLKQLNEESID